MAAAKARGSSTAAPPPSDAYVGLLGISLVALVFGSVLLLLDNMEYSVNKPPGKAPDYTILPKGEEKEAGK